jgi:hypothetical protein
MEFQDSYQNPVEFQDSYRIPPEFQDSAGFRGFWPESVGE